jgi:hypothetical protein
MPNLIDIVGQLAGPPVIVLSSGAPVTPHIPASSTWTPPRKAEVQAATATTSFYTVVPTAIPQDQFSIGVGQNGTDGPYCTSSRLLSLRCKI